MGLVLRRSLNIESVADFNVFWVINVKIKQLVKRFSLGLLLVTLLNACGQPEFVDSEGNGFEWQDFQGQWLVVNYWAEWCAPCREEVPELNALHTKAGWQVLGVNFDRPPLTELRRQMSALGVDFPVLQSEQGQRLRELTPRVLPATYVFDPQGVLRRTLLGPQTQASIELVMTAGGEKIE